MQNKRFLGLLTGVTLFWNTFFNPTFSYSCVNLEKDGIKVEEHCGECQMKDERDCQMDHDKACGSGPNEVYNISLERRLKETGEYHKFKEELCAKYPIYNFFAQNGWVIEKEIPIPVLEKIYFHNDLNNVKWFYTVRTIEKENKEMSKPGIPWYETKQELVRFVEIDSPQTPND